MLADPSQPPADFVSGWFYRTGEYEEPSVGKLLLDDYQIALSLHQFDALLLRATARLQAPPAGLPPIQTTRSTS